MQGIIKCKNQQTKNYIYIYIYKENEQFKSWFFEKINKPLGNASQEKARKPKLHTRYEIIDNTINHTDIKRILTATLAGVAQ